MPYLLFFRLFNLHWFRFHCLSPFCFVSGVALVRLSPGSIPQSALRGDGDDGERNASPYCTVCLPEVNNVYLLSANSL